MSVSERLRALKQRMEAAADAANFEAVKLDAYKAEHGPASVRKDIEVRVALSMWVDDDNAEVNDDSTRRGAAAVASSSRRDVSTPRRQNHAATPRQRPQSARAASGSERSNLHRVHGGITARLTSRENTVDTPVASLIENMSDVRETMSHNANYLQSIANHSRRNTEDAERMFRDLDGCRAAVDTRSASHAATTRTRPSSAFSSRDHSAQRRSVVAEGRGGTHTTHRDRPWVTPRATLATKKEPERAPVALRGIALTHTMEESCCICLDSLRRTQIVATLPCAHTFHHSCVTRWVNGKGSGNSKCPLCKSEITT
jgi:hypothetical protein